MLDQGQLNWIANLIWGIADDVLQDLYVRGKYRAVMHFQADILALEKEADELLDELVGRGGR